MSSGPATLDATPRPIYRALTVLCVAVIVGLIIMAITLGFTVTGKATTQDLAAQDRHRDCVTTIQGARRSVFDNVDIYKAILVKGAADRQFGLELDGDTAFFQGVDEALGVTLVEARRLQPAHTINRIVENGGMIDGVRYDPCPG